VNALADAEVGDYLNRHFVAAFQKVATFKIDAGQKQGGNVASYFCTPDGRVLHAVAGPVTSAAFLQEARWTNETYQLALLEKVSPDQLPVFFRKAHVARLEQEHNVVVPQPQLPQPGAFTPALLNQVLAENQHLDLSNQGKVHLLLVVAPTPQLHDVYRVVFENILNEKISTKPVEFGGN
jgi:hypothetical protein